MHNIMLSVKKLEDTVQCKWSIDYKGFLKCAWKRNENAEGAQREAARGKPLWIFVSFQQTL